MKNFLLILFTLIIYILIISIPLAEFKHDTVENEFIGELIKNSIIIILAIVAISRLHLNKIAGIFTKSQWNSKYLTLIPLYLILIGLTQAKDVDLTEVPTSSLVLLFISTLSIGFSEELVFRGILQSLFLKQLLKKKKTKFMILLSVLIPAFIFGLLHLLNFKAENTISEISQLLYATFIGTAFGAVLLRTNKLIPLAIIHGLIDFVFNLDELTVQIQNPDTSKSIISAIATVVIVAPMFIAGIVILRKVKISDITDRLTSSNT